MALGNLLPAIRDAYRSEQLDDETVRHLTLATLGQQRKWLRLFNDPHQHAPRGYHLKQWLFGGQQIATSHALFKLADYTGQVIEDLFGEDSYFADADLFWALQNRAIADKRDALLKSGWSAVEVLEVGQRFQQYEHVKLSKKKGGKVFIATGHDGAVEVFDGWLSQRDAKKLAKAEKGRDTEASPRAASTSGPVMTKALENYLDLHRHLAVRQALVAHPQIAFRLAVAHMLAPSGNWTVHPDPQTSRTPAIRASVDSSPATTAFAQEAEAVRTLLGWQEDPETAMPVRHTTADVFAHLLGLRDGEVMRIAAFAMAQSLQAGSEVVEEAGTRLAVDVRATWTAYDTFFDLIRDRTTVNRLLAEVAGETVAAANVAEKAKIQKQVIRDCLTGSNGRPKVEGWLPEWLAFDSPADNPPSHEADPIAA